MATEAASDESKVAPERDEESPVAEPVHRLHAPGKKSTEMMGLKERRRRRKRRTGLAEGGGEGRKEEGGMPGKKDV